MDDRRFRALSLAHRGAYATLIDEADAAGVYASAAGSTLRQTIARALGCSEAEGDAIVADLRAAGALDLDGPTLVLLVGTGAGACGGRPKALLMRVSRARSTGAGGNATGNRIGNAGGNDTGNMAVTDPGNTATAAAAQVPETTKESGGEKVVTDPGNKPAETAAEPLPSASLPSPLSHTLSSLTLPPASPPAGPKIAREEDAPKAAKTKRPKAAPTPDTIPAPGTLARRVFDAIVGDRILAPITVNPGDAAERWADPATYPGVNVLAEVKRAGEYAAERPGEYVDGRAFLRKWFKRAADTAARAPKVANGAEHQTAIAPPSSPVFVPTPSPIVVTDPAALARIRAMNARKREEDGL